MIIIKAIRVLFPRDLLSFLSHFHHLSPLKNRTPSLHFSPRYFCDSNDSKLKPEEFEFKKRFEKLKEVAEKNQEEIQKEKAFFKEITKEEAIKKRDESKNSKNLTALFELRWIGMLVSLGVFFFTSILYNQKKGNIDVFWFLREKKESEKVKGPFKGNLLRKESLGKQKMKKEMEETYQKEVEDILKEINLKVVAKSSS